MNAPRPGSYAGPSLRKPPLNGRSRRVRPFGQRIPAHFLEQLREGPDFVGENISFRRGDPFQPQIALIDPKELQYLVRVFDDRLAFLITCQVMTVTDVSAGDHDTVSPRFKGVQEKAMVHSSGAHEPDEPDVGGVLHSRHPRQVCPRIRAPVTQKRDDLGFKFVGHRCSSFSTSSSKAPGSQLLSGNPGNGQARPLQ